MENLKLKLALVAKEIEPEEDIKKLRRILFSLEREARIAIRLRFWECMTIQEIASVLEISWDNADKLIENSILKLRENFMNLKKQKALRAAS